MSVQPVEYIGSFDELLKKSEPSDPKFTSICVCQLPVTPTLHQRYCTVFSGPEAAQLQQIVLGWLDQLAEHLSKKKNGPDGGV
jgi:hypothetical protein